MDARKKRRKSLNTEYDKSSLEARFLCFCCNFMLSNPYQAECGCRYCYDCIDEVYEIRIQL